MGARVRVATVGQAARIATESPLGTEWPPPGLHVVGDPVFGLTEAGLPTLLYVVLEGDDRAIPDGALYWATLAEIMLGVDGWVDRAVIRLLELGGVSVPLGINQLASLPVVYEKGKGGFMRWIRVTHRGDLNGGVEQFQWKLDLGVPGSDPTLSEAAAPGLAEQLAGYFTAAWTTVQAASFAMRQVHSAEVVYTEIGCVEMTATSPTDSSGNGGNMEQSYSTGWYPWAIGTQPQGTATGFSLPYEVACAVTMQTDHRGSSGRGRFYLPPFSTIATTAGGLYDTSVRDSVGAALKQYLDAIVEGTPYLPLVVSPRRLILNDVKQALIGRVPDSQRRRRRNQDEARVVTWTQPA